MVAGLLAAVFLLLAAVAGVASVGYLQTKRALNAAEAAEATAKGEASRARTAEHEMRQQWYAATVNLMQPAWDTGQVGRLRGAAGGDRGVPRPRLRVVLLAAPLPPGPATP